MILHKRFWIDLYLGSNTFGRYLLVVLGVTGTIGGALFAGYAASTWFNWLWVVYMAFAAAVWVRWLKGSIDYILK